MKAESQNSFQGITTLCALSIYQEIREKPGRMLMEHTFSVRSTEKFVGINEILKR